jgi:2-iminobutanoate/2-iminopropanoate deaminase
MPELIATADAPKAIGPYSQAVRAGNLVFCSGQISINPETGTLIEGGVQDQTHQVLKNLEAVLTAAGTSLNNVVKTTVYLADMEEFATMNMVYETFFTANPPARATVEVSRLPKDVRVEIDAIAAID